MNIKKTLAITLLVLFVLSIVGQSVLAEPYEPNFKYGDPNFQFKQDFFDSSMFGPFEIELPYNLIPAEFNTAPKFSVGQKYFNAKEDATFTFEMYAADLESNSLKFSYNENLKGASIKSNGKSAKFTWTIPQSFTDADHKFQEINFVVSDGQASDTMKIIVNVENVNILPYIQTLNTITFTENEVNSHYIYAYDSDVIDTVKLSVDASTLPTGAKFISDSFSSGNIIWQPTFDQGNKEYKVVFTANDGKDTTNRIVTFKVVEKNQAPEFTMADQTVTVGTTLDLDLKNAASDKDKDPLTISIEGTLKDKFDATTGKFTWKTTTTDAGEHTLTVVVTDGVDAVKKDVKITIKAFDVNSNPIPPVNPAVPNPALPKTAVQLALDADYAALQVDFKALEDDFDQYQEDYNKAKKVNDLNNVDKYTTKLEKVDDKLKDLRNEVKDFITKAGNTAGDNKNIIDNAEELKVDIEDLRDDINVVLGKQSATSVSGNVFKSGSVTSQDSNKPVEVKMLQFPLTGGAVADTTSTGTGFGDLAFLIGGIVILFTIIMFLLVVLLK